MRRELAESCMLDKSGDFTDLVGKSQFILEVKNRGEKAQYPADSLRRGKASGWPCTQAAAPAASGPATAAAVRGAVRALALRLFWP